ncbi:hypothetical protein ABID22_000260 [Pontibacter aydingkolensis]|uniref:Uncharacterized protein n=1 Tax=Pontibacter aydingkolensis TaxID=1911536 RepID=A0ABS7CQE9_9BACT|nr:hypothetical protein [Pontibacter aydingkolensis]MBW7466074.1 hypothetical protein [Pontibacter aydingkolensis]
MFLIIAVLGYFGQGGLLVGHEKAGGPAAGLEVEYEPYIRKGTPTKLTLTYHKQSPQPELRINKTFIYSTHLEQIVPEPSGASADETSVTYTFDALGKGAVVVLYFKPEKIRDLHTILSDGSSSVTLEQFVHP